MDIVFPHVPCDILGLNYRDQLNNQESDYIGKLHKHRISKEGESLSVEKLEDKQDKRSTIKERTL